MCVCVCVCVCVCPGCFLASNFSSSFHRFSWAKNTLTVFSCRVITPPSILEINGVWSIFILSFVCIEQVG